MPDPCDPLRNKVRDLELAIEDAKPEKGERPSPILLKLKQQLAKAVAQLRECENPSVPLPPPTPVPVRLRCGGVRCYVQDDNLGDDEPYVLAFAMDLAAPSNSKITRVGPIENVDGDGNFKAFPDNFIWGLSGGAQLVSSADNLLCVVALVENDDANPDTVRQTTETLMRLPLAPDFAAYGLGQIPRDELVRRVVNAMNGAIPVASVAFPGPDDQIGSAQEVRFLQGELDILYLLGRSIDKSLQYKGDGANYVVYFHLER